MSDKIMYHPFSIINKKTTVYLYSFCILRRLITTLTVDSHFNVFWLLTVDCK